MEQQQWTDQDFLSCSGSRRFAGEMVAAAPFADLDHVLRSARDIWFNKIDVKGWLESFAAHPEIGSTSKSISQFCKQEQSTAMATATDSTLQELVEWNARYRERFGFVFLICASGRGSPDILAELKKRYSNRPIVELEKAAEEEMKIIELRLAKLFEGGRRSSPSVATDKPGGDIRILFGDIQIISFCRICLIMSYVVLATYVSYFSLGSMHISLVVFLNNIVKGKAIVCLIALGLVTLVSLLFIMHTN